MVGDSDIIGKLLLDLCAFVFALLDCMCFVCAGNEQPRSYEPYDDENRGLKLSRRDNSRVLFDAILGFRHR